MNPTSAVQQGSRAELKSCKISPTGVGVGAEKGAGVELRQNPPHCQLSASAWS